MQTPRFRRDRCHRFRQADAEVHDVPSRISIKRTASDDLCARKTAAGGAVAVTCGGDKGLVEFSAKVWSCSPAPRDDDVVHQHARHAHRLRIGDAIHDALHLGDDDAAVIFRGLRDGQHLADDALAFHGEIAARVGAGGANEPDMHRHGLVAQPLLAVERRRVRRAAPWCARFIRPPACRGSMKVFMPILVKMPGRFAAISRSSTQTTPWGNCRPRSGCPAPVCPSLGARFQWPPMTRFTSPGVREVIQAAIRAVPLTRRIEQRQVTRRLRFEKALLQRCGQHLRMGGSDKAADGHRGPVGDGGDGLRRR